MENIAIYTYIFLCI